MLRLDDFISRGHAATTENLLTWDICGCIHFKFVAPAPYPSGVDPDLASGLVTQMVEAAALPGSANGVRVALANNSEGRRDAQAYLEDHGIIGLGDDRVWRLTYKGVSCLASMIQLVRPCRFFRPDIIPVTMDKLGERTKWELCMLLQRAGWTAEVIRKKPLPYTRHIDGEEKNKVWHFSLFF